MFDPLSSRFLKATFGTLQELRFVRLIELHMNHWTAALSPGLCHEEFNVGDADDIFASLAELQVEVALARRKAKGYALKKLVIEASDYVSKAQVKKLRTVVDEVDWDGYSLSR
ncbi:hypothetical protein BU15DRAFT_81181 [Melanogaster broomeanus]|nr:hypothetical protein BU15DRAFT_81181 [Melanogaster broomeanus]